MEFRTNGFNELQAAELEDINGGGPLLIAGIVVGVVCVGAFALGVYNGYKDNKK